MSSIESEKVKNLLIIGNGFDLARHIPTSFSDYIDEYNENNFQQEKENFTAFLKKLHNFIKNSSATTKWTFNYIKSSLESEIPIKFESVSFWDIILLTKRYISENITAWSDIETQIYNFLIIDKKIGNYNINLNKSLEHFELPSSGYLLNSTEDRVIAEYKEKSISLETIAYKFIYILMNGNNNENYYDFIFNQLKKFENNFSDYLSKILIYGFSQDGIDIKNSRNKLVDEIFKGLDNKKFNLLDFNYDAFHTNDLKKEIHIHGSTNKNCHKPIIIGIDSSGITPDQPIYRFTKTYRIMEQSFGDPVKIIDKNIKNIFFYGHSLSEADYSYFNAIFDSLDLYNSDVTLTFCYSIYNPKKSEEIKNNQMKSISKLIYKYGTTLQNDHGDNLLHKMLLENRLRLKNIQLNF